MSDAERIREICAAIRREAVKRTEFEDLWCQCAICGTAITIALRLANYWAELCVGAWGADYELERESHCWTLVGDWVYDVTATQFGDYDDVLETLWDSGCYSTEFKIIPLNEAYDYFLGWPAEQQPYPSLMLSLVRAAIPGATAQQLDECVEGVQFA